MEKAEIEGGANDGLALVCWVSVARMPAKVPAGIAHGLKTMHNCDSPFKGPSRMRVRPVSPLQIEGRTTSPQP